MGSHPHPSAFMAQPPSPACQPAVRTPWVPSQVTVQCCAGQPHCQPKWPRMGDPRQGLEWLTTVGGGGVAPPGPPAPRPRFHSEKKGNFQKANIGLGYFWYMNFGFQTPPPPSLVIHASPWGSSMELPQQGPPFREPFRCCLSLTGPEPRLSPRALGTVELAVVG